MARERLLAANPIQEALLPELRSRARWKPIQVVSDFDETLSSVYVYSAKLQTHVPKIRADLAEQAQRLNKAICLATARTPTDQVSWIMWHRLSRQPMPLVTENGAVLAWPSNRPTQPARVEILASPRQIETIKEIEKELKGGLIADLLVPTGHEVVLRPNRIATVEIRSQDSTTKRGTPDDYASLVEQLWDLFPEAAERVEIVSSGSSLGIQPKGVTKESGIRAALLRSGVEIRRIFLVGLGDNSNDEPLFNFVRNAGGLAIGVRPGAKGKCDFVFDGGDEASLQVLKAVNSL